MTERLDQQAEATRIRRHRNVVLGFLLGGFVILIFFVSIAKMS